MSANDPTDGGSHGITQHELRAVIRRAAELYTAETEAADERIPEDEVLRVAEELGLPARHVRRALYELPRDPEASSLLDRIYGAPAVVATRSIPSETGLTLRQLEDYLTTREYFETRRRQPGLRLLRPADDTLSGIARRLRRPRGRYRLAHADRIVVAARPLEPGETHVRLDLEYRRQRRRLAFGGVGLGAIAGAALGSGAATLVESVAPGVLGAVGEAAAFAGGFGASVAGGVAVSVSRFRRHAAAARVEVAGLLDRLERAERLEQPASPWLRRWRLRLQKLRRLPG